MVSSCFQARPTLIDVDELGAVQYQVVELTNTVLCETIIQQALHQTHAMSRQRLQSISVSCTAMTDVRGCAEDMLMC